MWFQLAVEGDVDGEAVPKFLELLGLTKGDTEDAVVMLEGDVGGEAVPVIGELPEEDREGSVGTGPMEGVFEGGAIGVLLGKSLGERLETPRTCCSFGRHRMHCLGQGG